jgi:hypothetical protein
MQRDIDRELPSFPLILASRQRWLDPIPAQMAWYLVRLPRLEDYEEPVLDLEMFQSDWLRNWQGEQ